MTSLTETPTLDAAGRELLFTEARSANTWTDEPVTDEQLRIIRELAKWGPTAANSNPGRILFLRQDAGRDRLIPHLNESNRAKTAAAPAVAVLAFDPKFHDLMPALFPGRGEGMQQMWEADSEARHGIGRFNGALQAGYFILAVRAAGLAAGPMGGFNAEAIDAEFFAESGWKSLLVVNIGHPGADAWHPRLPRPSEDDAVSWL